MAKRHSDPCQYFLGSVPTLGDKCIHTSKLPSNREVLFSFVIRKEEEYAKNKTFKSSFKAAMATVQEEILPIYSRARIPTKSERNIAQGIIELHKKLQDLMKIKKEKREIVKSKEKIESFKQSLKETMVCWPKDALHKIKNEEDKAFLVSMQTDRIASLAGQDLKTHQAEKKQKEKKLMKDLGHLKSREVKALLLCLQAVQMTNHHLLMKVLTWPKGITNV